MEILSQIGTWLIYTIGFGLCLVVASVFAAIAAGIVLSAFKPPTPKK